jgi:hypothetical protein
MPAAAPRRLVNSKPIDDYFSFRFQRAPDSDLRIGDTLDQAKHQLDPLWKNLGY